MFSSHKTTSINKDKVCERRISTKNMFMLTPMVFHGMSLTTNPVYSILVVQNNRDKSLMSILLFACR